MLKKLIDLYCRPLNKFELASELLGEYARGMRKELDRPREEINVEDYLGLAIKKCYKNSSQIFKS